MTAAAEVAGRGALEGATMGKYLRLAGAALLVGGLLLLLASVFTVEKKDRQEAP